MIFRHLRESLRSLIRNGWMSFASISAVAITLLILGVSLVITLNAQSLSTYVEGQLEVDVYLQPNLSDAQGQQIAAQIKQLPGVASVSFVSKEAGFKQLETSIGKQFDDVLGALEGNNPLPVQLVVKAVNPRETLGVARMIQSQPGVQQVNDGKQYVDKLFSFLDVIRNIGLAFVVGLIVTAMFLISNTIKITIFSRRREIEIMKLVGATNWFIRWPFVWEGVIIGAVGTLIPYAILVYGYQSLFSHLSGTFFVLAFPLIAASQVAEKLAIVLFGIGVLIGLWGGIMSVRRFLRV